MKQFVLVVGIMPLTEQDQLQMTPGSRHVLELFECGVDVTPAALAGALRAMADYHAKSLVEVCE